MRFLRRPRPAPEPRRAPDPVDADTLAAAFTEAYQRPPEGVWRAPGRINLIGEHTDYNDGLVLPFALPRGVWAAAARRDDDVVEVRSLQAAGQGAAAGPGDRVTGWAAYPAGVAELLREHGVRGASLLFDSDLPQGAGLASSAALECAAAVALCDLYGIDLERAELARLAQRAENDYAGVPCGPMDQAASLLCEAGRALLLDCRSGLSGRVPFDPAAAGLTLLAVDTGARHALTGGEYANRRAECERAAEELGVAALRDVTDLAGALSTLDDPVLRRRVQHVVTENHRVEAAAGLLRAGAVAELGAMLTASHLSLRDQFQVSWPEADAALDAALRAGARGGRMVGAGFGGSVIVLVAQDRADRVRAAIATAYTTRTWPSPLFLEALPSAGAGRVR
ncbi:galactokinase [Actinomadura macrotermitis]|uniref:Galactokinase n=1 Tax=Actinomadura macrotermitis TaxID=2585200 RepID=A0A7K0C3L5_9ACTN|nr:galactokinase [Actinomadura macrotermitis]MQY07404.1 Galactokinase [Actinomadura macrotermitis]